MPAPHHSSFYRPDAPNAQSTASKHWRQYQQHNYRTQDQLRIWQQDQLYHLRTSPTKKRPVTTSLCRLKTATGMYGRRMSQTLRLKSSSWAQLDKWYVHCGRHLTRAVDAIDCTVNIGVSMCRWSALESNTCSPHPVPSTSKTNTCVYAPFNSDSSGWLTGQSKLSVTNLFQSSPIVLSWGN